MPMNLEHEQQLEAVIHRELRVLPELSAPPGLADRVLHAIEQRTQLPWYRRSWPSWPVIWQATSFALLLALFGGLCLAGRELSQAETALQARHLAGECLSGLNLVGNTFTALANAVVLVLKKLGPGIIAAGLVMAGLGYALCVGLGTMYFRIAFVQREETDL